MVIEYAPNAQQIDTNYGINVHLLPGRKRLARAVWAGNDDGGHYVIRVVLPCAVVMDKRV
jgi:hypothetical protein